MSLRTEAESKRLEVLHVTRTDCSNAIGGIQSFIRLLHSSLLKVKVQSRIIDLGFQSEKQSRLLKAFRIPFVGEYPYYMTLALIVTFSSLKYRKGRCIIHAHDTFFGGLTGVLIKFMIRKPLLITDHGIQSMVEVYEYKRRHGDTLYSRLIRGFLLVMEKFVVYFADRLICVGEYSYDYFLKRGVNPRKMKIVLNGIDVEMFKPKRRAFSNDGITILYAGRISAEKHISGLTKVFSLLERDYPSLKLLIVGEGRDENNIEKMLRKLRINDKAFLLPSVKADVLVDLYNDTDIIAIPSAMETGTPLALLEAMACARVVIVNSSGSLPPLVDDAGLIVPFDNPKEAVELIKRILNDKKEAVRLAGAARQRAIKNFNWQNCFEQILSTYASVQQKL